ncbi:MAG: Mur ligase domain-containing protein, partial [Verrucomicrobiota bacterium]
MKHFHIVGAAGVGMSALAEFLIGLGHRVSGSDRFHDEGRTLDVLEKLQRRGLRITAQDGSGVSTDTEAVVVSTAIEADNPELAAARDLKIPVKHRAEVLSELTRNHQVIAVAGTAGKTTVTGLIGWLLEQAGRDPTVVNGGGVLNWMDDTHTGSVRTGGSDLCVLEVDESDRSLLGFEPEVALINNVSKDHFDLDETWSLFRTFAAQVRRTLICGEGVSGGLGDIGCPPGRVECPFLCEEAATGVGFYFTVAGERYTSRLVGRHNAENAFLATMVCRHLGIEPSVIQRGLE